MYIERIIGVRVSRGLLPEYSQLIIEYVLETKHSKSSLKNPNQSKTVYMDITAASCWRKLAFSEIAYHVSIVNLRKNNVIFLFLKEDSRNFPCTV